MFNFTPIVDIIKVSKPLQFALVFVAGGTVAALFYPTKQIKETLQKTYQQQISTIQQQNAQTIATQQASYQKLSDQYSSYKTQTDAKINDLTTQVSSLKTHHKTTTFKIVHPDGTIEERDTTEDNIDSTKEVTQELQQEWQQKTDQQVQTVTQQFQQQISTMQSQWSSKEQSYQQTVATLQSTKTETINPKNFTLDVGMLTNADYYGHVTYNLLGPIVLGLQAQLGSSPSAGAGVGLRF
jgi:hypothetical protein